MKLAKYILGLALVAGSFALTSCDQENEGAIYEPQYMNVTFMTPSQYTMTGESSITVPVAVSRAMTNGEYTATVEMADATPGMSLKNQQVTFANGEGMAYVYVVVSNMDKGATYTCTLNLTGVADTKNPDFGEQLTSTSIEILCDYNWIPAGIAEFTDYTWYDPPMTANIPVENAEGTNMYRIVSPLFYLYNGYEDNPDKSNFNFTLNADGSIDFAEGGFLNWWGYVGYYVPSDYPSYCFIAQDGNTYDVNFLLLNGSDLYTGGEFVFTWNR